MTQEEIGKNLVIDPEICHGQMTFKNTRVPVASVLTFLGKGYSIEQLLQNWPELTQDAIEEAVYLASQALQASYPVPRQVTAESFA
ncbi:MAG: DUF433 domain-containing protein [Chloroflexi bacterium]|nr:DUF433 domain-containing protein [Chloroflexota bacterium]